MQSQRHDMRQFQFEPDHVKEWPNSDPKVQIVCEQDGGEMGTMAKLVGMLAALRRRNQEKKKNGIRTWRKL